MKCIFCSNNLDNSDEHIILYSLNGKLHSKEIICSECNNFFGSQLDNVAKKFFNIILLSFQFKNASGEIAENLKGEDKFLFQKDLTTKQVKLDISEFKSKGKRLISISGNAKDAMKKFEKLAKNLENAGSKIIAKSIEEVTRGVPLRIKVDFKTNPEINILLNKIALEYCHYKKVPDLNTKELALRIRALDKTLSNVFYCNLTEEIRKFSDREITHCIFLKKIDTKLIVYIELFNVICSVIVIDEKYAGEAIEYQYYQNAITGEKINCDLEINLNEVKKLLESSPVSIVDFNPLANKLFFRKRDKDFSDEIDRELNLITIRLQNELKNKQITQNEYSEKYINECSQMVAQLSIENPYLLDDVDDANNDELNYYHSNIREEQFEEFSNTFKQLIGKKVNYDDKIYLIEEFSQVPIAEQNGIKISRLYICLFNGFNRVYLPYRDFFEGIILK